MKVTRSPTCGTSLLTLGRRPFLHLFVSSPRSDVIMSASEKTTNSPMLSFGWTSQPLRLSGARHGGRRQDRERSHILLLAQMCCTLNLPPVSFGLSLLPAVRQLLVNFPLLPISAWKQQIDFK